MNNPMRRFFRPFFVCLRRTWHAARPGRHAWMEDTTARTTLWPRWIAANALGELFGLGLTFAVTAYVFTWLDGVPGVVALLLSFLFAVLSGILEATIVGLAQWWAMHPWFSDITRRAWWLATLAGALVAYVLGYLPSTIMGLGETASSAPPPAEPPQWIVLLLAAGLGALGGAVLSFAQWLVLRRHVAGARWWIPGNMLAWLFGMPIIFWGIDVAQRTATLPLTVLILAVCLLVAGAVVGAIHGAFLARLASQPFSPSGASRS